MFDTVGRSTMPKTLATQQSQQRVERALDNLRDASPSLLFARRWQLLQARAYGGQAVVQVRSSNHWGDVMRGQQSDCTMACLLA
jgi:hypothetical protein